jgi:hypothetical protein
VPERDIAELAKVRYFPETGVVCVVTDWGPEGKRLAFKCGPPIGRSLVDDAIRYNFAHHVPENNAFFYSVGRRSLITSGGSSYWKMTAQQNTVLVDGRGQWGDGFVWFPKITKEHAGTINHFHTSDEFTLARGDATNAYPPERGLKSFTRDFLFAADRYLILHDVLESDTAREYQWLAHSFGEIEPAGESRYTFRHGDAEVDLFVLAPARFGAKTDETCIVVPYSGSGRCAEHLELEAGVAPVTEFLVVLAPPDLRPDTPELIAGPGYIGARIVDRRGELTAVFNRGGGEVAWDDMKTDAPYALVWRPRARGGKKPRSWAAIDGGTYLTQGRRRMKAKGPVTIKYGFVR